MKLSIGDTFRNSVGKQITVKNIHNSGNRCELSCPEWASTYHHDIADIVDRIRLGHYTDYRSIKTPGTDWTPKKGVIIVSSSKVLQSIQ